MKVVGIDVDDVSAQFRKRFVELTNEVCKLELSHTDAEHHYDCEVALKLTKEQEDLVWSLVSKKGFCTDLELVPGAGDAIEELAKTHEIVFITKPFKHSATWVSDRHQWILKHFGKTIADSAIYTASKYHVDADYFIDDRIDMVDRWFSKRVERRGGLIQMANGGYYPRAILYPWLYNSTYQGVAYRADCWKNITSYINAHHKFDLQSYQ